MQPNLKQALIALLGNSQFLGNLAGVIDGAFPWFVGNRTKITAIVCPLLSVAGPFVPPPYNAAVPVAQMVLCGAGTAFAAAGLVRDAQTQVKASTAAKS